MPEPKTRPTSQSVPEFLESIQDERVRRDCWTLVEIMKKATGAEPQLWGPNIVGFGSYRMKYADGKEADWTLVAFSPRKSNLTLYIMPGFANYKSCWPSSGSTPAASPACTSSGSRTSTCRLSQPSSNRRSRTCAPGIRRRVSRGLHLTGTPPPESHTARRTVRPSP